MTLDPSDIPFTTYKYKQVEFPSALQQATTVNASPPFYLQTSFAHFFTATFPSLFIIRSPNSSMLYTRPDLSVKWLSVMAALSKRK
jgi:hypothetical protein